MQDSNPAPQGAFASLIEPLRRAVADQGYVTPTPIQEQCLPHIIAGRDVLGVAQTGTGKTAAFTLPLLQLLHDAGRPRPGSPKALILAPTRELAAQIGDSIAAYSRHLPLRHTVIFGGVSQLNQVKALRRGVDILVATPGRLLDLMGQGHIRLGHVQLFVLDEVDRMLDMGFIPDIKRVLAEVPEARQTLFFSATMGRKIGDLAATMVTDPVHVTITPDAPAVARIAQRVMYVAKSDKCDLLTSLLEGSDIGKAIVFIQMKHVANRIAQKLDRAGIPAAVIHGNKTQNARTRALNDFKRNRFHVLVATDVAARGLDVDDITHVINYDLPTEAETYVHRIGRTARAGADGDAISFCSAEDRGSLRDIERLLGGPVPVHAEHAFHCEDARRTPTHASGNGAKRGGAQRQRRQRSRNGGRARVSH